MVFPFSSKTLITPLPLSGPPAVNVPPLILSANIVPAVIKSATNPPSNVAAVLYGPSYPFVE